jgi:hypothetical protein
VRATKLVLSYRSPVSNKSAVSRAARLKYLLLR